MAAIVKAGGGGGISNGYLIEGVAHITDSTVPATRPDGTALVDGDRWYDSSTGREWIRKGIYWLGERIIIGAGTLNGGNSISATSNLYDNIFFRSANIYVEEASLNLHFADRNQDATDHWDIEWGLAWMTSSGVNTALQTIAADTQDGGLLQATQYLFVTQVNTAYTLGNAGDVHYRPFLRVVKTGANTNRMNASGSLIYREIYA